MVGEEATRHRAMVARCNFLGCDRPDIQFAAKEASRWMSKPCREDQDKVTRIGKYLNGGLRRMEQVFPFGRDDSVICAYSDSDWAGCLRTRKSTSGGILCIGGCMIKHWSSTQKAIALSSAEAELYAATRALSEAKGLKSLGMDFGESLSIRAYVDAQATIGLSHRAGLGKARHIETAELWIQDALERREFELLKIPGEQNPADILTKPVPRDTMDRHLWTLGCRAVPADRNP